MKVKKYIIVWFKTVLLGSLLATVLSIPIILIKMEYHLMSTISIIIPFIVITIIVSLITSIPTIAVMIKLRESLLRDKTETNVIITKINLIHWLGGIITFIIIAFVFEFGSLALTFLVVYMVSFLSIGHLLWQKELKTSVDRL
ncbi:hypothetical protein MWU50_06460 [Flavobacteriaceae bacterium S0862]|nr:hypothetical protein [Flavobacteriaceae bacterium S0862]